MLLRGIPKLSGSVGKDAVVAKLTSPQSAKQVVRRLETLMFDIVDLVLAKTGLLVPKR